MAFRYFRTSPRRLRVFFLLLKGSDFHSCWCRPAGWVALRKQFLNVTAAVPAAMGSRGRSLENGLESPVIRGLNYCLLLFLLSSNDTLAARSFSAEVSSFHLEIVGERLFPGDIFGVIIRCTKPIKETAASFAGRKLIFYSSKDNQQWYGLAGIDLETKAGRYLIQGTLRFEHGGSEGFERPLQVLPKKFPVQHIQVDERYVTLDPEDSKRAEEETKKLEALWKTASPQKFWQGPFLKPIASGLSSGFGRRRIVNNQDPHSGSQRWHGGFGRGIFFQR